MMDEQDTPAHPETASPQQTPASKKTRAKRLLGCLLVLAVLFVVGLGVMISLPFFFKDEILARVLDVLEAKYHRKATIGAVEVRGFPTASFTLKSLKVMDRAGFAESPMLEVENFELDVKVLALLGGDVIVDRIVLERPRIHIVRNEKGEWSFDDLVHTTAAIQFQRGGKPRRVAAFGAMIRDACADERASSSMIFTVKKASIVDAVIDVDDHLERRHPRLDECHLELTMPSLDAAWDVSMHMRLPTDKHAGRLALTGAVTALQDGRFSMDALAADDLEVQLDAVDASYYEPYLRPFLPFRLHGGVFHLQAHADVSKGLAHVQTELHLQIQDGSLETSIRIPPPEGAPADAPAITRSLSLEQDLIRIDFDGSVDNLLQASGQTARIRHCTLKSDFMTASIAGTASDFKTPLPMADLQLTLDADIAPLARIAGQLRTLPVGDPQGRLHFQGAVRGDTRRVHATGRMNVSGTRFTLPAQGAGPVALDKVDLAFELAAMDYLTDKPAAEFPRLEITTDLGTFHLSGSAKDVLTNIQYHLTDTGIRIPDLKKAAELAKRFNAAIPMVPSGAFSFQGGIERGTMDMAEGIQAEFTFENLALPLPALGDKPFRQDRLKLSLAANAGHLRDANLSVYDMKGTVDSELFSSLEIAGKAQPLSPSLPFDVTLQGGVVLHEISRVFAGLIPPQAKEMKGLMTVNVSASGDMSRLAAKGEIDLSDVTGEFSDLLVKHKSGSEADVVALRIHELKDVSDGFDPANMRSRLHVLLHHVSMKQKVKSDKPDPRILDFSASLSTDAGIAVIEQMSAKVCGGTLQSTLTSDFSGTRNFTLMDRIAYRQGDMRLRGVDMNQVVRVFTAYGDVFYGTLDFAMHDLRGQGTGLRSLERHLQAKGDFKLLQGRLENLDQQPVLQGAIKLLKVIPDMPDLATFPFKVGKGQYNIRKGRVEIEDLEFSGNKQFKVKMEGAVKLDEHFTCRLSIRLKPTRQSGIDLDGITRWLDKDRYIPVLVTGPARKPKLDFDWKRIGRAATGQVEKQARDKAGDELRKILGGKEKKEDKKDKKKQKKKKQDKDIEDEVKDKLKDVLEGLF